MDGDFEGEDVTFFESFFLTAELTYDAASNTYSFEVKVSRTAVGVGLRDCVEVSFVWAPRSSECGSEMGMQLRVPGPEPGPEP